MSIFTKSASSCCLLLLPAFCLGQDTIRLRGEVVDADTGKPIACRIYLQSADGEWHFARSANESGSAVEYRKSRDKGSVEMHTTLSAHPFVAELPPGEYSVIVERGKEYLPQTKRIEVHERQASRQLSPGTVRLRDLRFGPSHGSCLASSDR